MAKEVKQSKTRAKMYKFMADIIGRTLTPKEHEDFKQIIREYFDSTTEFVEYKKALGASPLKHVLICRDCAIKKEVIGYKEFHNVYKGKRRGFVSS